MTLQNEFNNKLSHIINNVERTRQAYLKTLSLIKSFFISESIDSELNRLFALKNNELKFFYNKLSRLIEQIKVIEKHKDAITSKEYRIGNALELFDKLADSNSELFSEIQALLLYLENRLKDR